MLEGYVWGRLPELKDRHLYPPFMERAGHILLLNGRGIHKASIFKVKIYEISLFLENPSDDAESILSSSQQKMIVLKFLRQVEAEQLRIAFLDAFQENCPPSLCDHLRGYLDQMNSKVPDLRENDQLEFEFFENKVILRSSLGIDFEVKNPDFGKILLSIWLGSDPPSQNLKKQILGVAP